MEGKAWWGKSVQGLTNLLRHGKERKTAGQDLNKVSLFIKQGLAN